MNWFRTAILLATLTTRVSVASVWHVSSTNGNDANSGQSENAPFRSVQKACDQVAPGDTVIVHPGVYLEHIQLKTAGTSDKPITFQSDKVEKDRVILSGADPTIRNGTVWHLDDQHLQLYSVPFTFRPARVLYDHNDLLPYPDLQTLKDFRAANGYPGADDGFAFENGRLFVRLHAGGKYGSTDPNTRSMAVAPHIGKGFQGLSVDGPQSYCFGVLLGGGDAHVIFDGFTFETPGSAAIYADCNDVVVRNCWFFGCRAGVEGRPESPDPAKTSNRITIEYCDISQYPTFDDMKEVIVEHATDPWLGDRKTFPQRIYWWQRKAGMPSTPPQERGDRYTYETGIGVAIGSDWTIRHNYLHDGVEYLSCWATRWSKNLQAYQNRFERIVDNAVEAEDHAVNEHFFENACVDVFEPFSWQPLDGHPWPGPIYFDRNVVWMTPENVGLWTKAGWTPGIWKLGAEEGNWKRPELHLPADDVIRAAGEGFISCNNTILCPDHVMLTRVQSSKRTMENFHIFNNVVDALGVCTNTFFEKDHVEFAANLVTFSKEVTPTAAAMVTANGGKAVASVGELKLVNPAIQDIRPAAGSPAVGLHAPITESDALPDAGAVSMSDVPWKPPVVGPQSK